MSRTTEMREGGLNYDAPLTVNRVEIRGILIAQKIEKIETQHEKYSEIQTLSSETITHKTHVMYTTPQL